ncbi:MAG: hypothetical protein PHW19_12305 [Salinivirgaceae bacterium]|nr:hypothetical protein [Salinivirgaceae bacterium]
MALRSKNAVLALLREQQRKQELEDQINTQADDRIEEKVGTDEIIGYLKDGKKDANTPLVSKMDLELENVENLSASNIISQLTKDDVKSLITITDLNGVDVSSFENLENTTPKVFEQSIVLDGTEMSSEIPKSVPKGFPEVIEDGTDMSSIVVVKYKLNRGITSHSFVLTIGMKTSLKVPFFMDTINVAINNDCGTLIGSCKYSGQTSGFLKAFSIHEFEEYFYILINEDADMSDFKGLACTLFVRFEPSLASDISDVTIYDNIETPLSRDSRVFMETIQKIDKYSEAYWVLSGVPEFKYGYSGNSLEYFGKEAASTEELGNVANTIPSNSKIQTLANGCADSRILAKIGDDKVINYLKAGKKWDGSFVTASEIKYVNGATLESLKPAQAGADITSANTANDTANVNGIAAVTIEKNALAGNEAKEKLLKEVGDKKIETTAGTTAIVSNLTTEIANLGNTIPTEGTINSLADERAIAQIIDKVGTQDIINFLKEGKKADGTTPLISKNDIGLTNVEDKSVTEIQTLIVQATRTQMVDTNWVLGSGGNTSFYSLKGNGSENYRVMGLNHKNEKVILWECRPDSTSGNDGGFNTHSFPIDKNKTYRFSIFVKTSNNSGKTYLGCGSRT